MGKLRLLLETDDETNGLCLQWVPYIPGTTAQDVLVLIRNLSVSKQEVGLILCPFKNITGGREPTLPSEHLEALRYNRKFELQNIPNIIVNIFTT